MQKKSIAICLQAVILRQETTDPGGKIFKQTFGTPTHCNVYPLPHPGKL